MRLCAIFMPLLMFCSPSEANEWNQWRGANRDGYATNSPQLLEKLPSEGLKPAWVSQEEIPSARAGGWSSPVLSDGRVYLYTHGRLKTSDTPLPPQKYPYLSPDKRSGLSDQEYAEYERKRRDEQQSRSRSFRYDETVFCLDATKGKTIWKKSLASVYTRFPQSGSPAVVDGRIFVLGAGRQVRCFAADTGESIWVTKLPGDFRDEFLQASVAVAEDVAIVMCGSLFGLDVKSGKILWEGDQDSTRGDHSSPIVWKSPAGALVIVNVARGETICVEAASGVERWRVESLAGRATPILVGDRLITYGSSRKKGLRCFRITPTSAELEWAYQGVADAGSSPVAVSGRIYVQGDRRLACVNVETGKADWSATLNMNRPRYTSLVAADDKVFYAFDGLLCFTATPNAYAHLFTAKIDEAGLMASEKDFRAILGIDQLETTAEGQKEAERLWRRKFDGGPLPCASPAIADGKIYLRLKNRLVCYDLRAG